MLKHSGAELAAFTKRNAERCAVLSDLNAAKSVCKTGWAQAMISGLIRPIKQELEKDYKDLNKRLEAAWKPAKSEPLPKEVLKKVNELAKKYSKELETKDGPKPEIKYRGGFGITLHYGKI